MKQIEEVTNVTTEQFNNEIRIAQKPIVMRGLVSHWPVVKAALKSDKDCVDYISSFANSKEQNIANVPFEYNGRLHYLDDLQGFNFTWSKLKLADYLNRLLNDAKLEKPIGMALQALLVNQELLGFETLNPRVFAPDKATPHMWISNEMKIATHADTVDNLACVVAGCRRFTIFPPEQVKNLYIGPLHYTPAGPPISMVHLTNPDYDKYPKFAQAMETAQYVDLYPGDALFLPFRWYHHVEAKKKLNILLNYWWSDARIDIGSPLNAFMHCLYSVGNLPPHQRAAWREIFENYVFHTNGDPWEHMPFPARGPFVDPLPERANELRDNLIWLLQNNKPMF